MPSPSPGMDPYLEAPFEWPDMHHGLLGRIRTIFAERVAPHYIVIFRVPALHPDTPQVLAIPRGTLLGGAHTGEHVLLDGEPAVIT